MMGSLFRALLWLLAILPRRVSQWLGRRLGALNYRFNTRSAKVSRSNIELCYPTLSREAREVLVAASLTHTGQTLFEIPAMWLGSRGRMEKWIEEVRDEAIFDAARSSGRGVLVLLPHFGNWELFNVYVAGHGATTALYHPPRQPALRPVMEGIRQHFGNRMVATNVKGIARLFRDLDQGKTVTILPDQVPASGVFSPFLGVPALTDRLVPRLLQRTGAIAVAVINRRLENGRFSLEFIEPDESIYSDDMALAAAGLNATVARCVQRAPDQYQWEYKRFRERPPGEPKLYRFGKPVEYH
ncbi:MAG: lysophospholipid acyltransferase family protein [Proteobacteria bacterium]|nr:lysophospholipid acyltransferase family protein [Pseudomonadota bacterium]